MPDRKRQTAKTPAQAFSETINPLVRDRVGLEDSKNRALQKNIKGKDQNDFTIGIKDIDESIVFYFDEVIKPTVLQNGKKKNVPVIYGNQERWKAVQKDGFYRDKNGKIQAPLIMFRRETLEKNFLLPCNLALIESGII